MKASLHTLGCRLNQSESAIIAKNLELQGYEISGDDCGLDLCVINTCTLTRESDAKSRQTIRQFRKKNPDALIAVIGCYPQIAEKEIEAIDGVDLIIGNNEKLNLHKYLSRAKKSVKPIIVTGPIAKVNFTIETTEQSRLTTRANIKIQDGCDFACSYCIIPKARGRARSREWKNIREEARKLGAMGSKELVLTGVNIGAYKDANLGLTELINVLNEVPGIERIRISSIEPTTVDERLFAMMRDPENKLVPFLHLPVQSASDIILKKMRRHYVFSEYLDFLRAAIDSVPGICLGSDVMVGFPGEEEENFAETLQNLETAPVHFLHVFPYSERPGTSAEKLPNKIEKKIISRRSQILRELSFQKRNEFMQSFVGKELEVLFEEQTSEGLWKGYSENFIRVGVVSEQELKNEIVTVMIERIESNEARGIPNNLR